MTDDPINTYLQDSLKTSWIGKKINMQQCATDFNSGTTLYDKRKNTFGLEYSHARTHRENYWLL